MTTTPEKIEGLRNNCTLVAVKEVTGKADQEIIQKFLEKGWIPGQGCTDWQYITAARELGAEINEVPTRISGRSAWIEGGWRGDRINPARYPSLGQFVKDHPKGVFIVRNPGHAFVVRDGKVIDPNVVQGARKKLRRRIHGAWEVLNPSPSTFVERVKADVHHQLKRGEDPIVAFTYMGSDRRRGTKGYSMEYQARCFIGFRARIGKQSGVYLSELLKETTYDRAMASYDLRRGILRVVKKEESIYA